MSTKRVARRAPRRRSVDPGKWLAGGTGKGWRLHQGRRQIHFAVHVTTRSLTATQNKDHICAAATEAPRRNGYHETGVALPRTWLRRGQSERLQGYSWGVGVGPVPQFRGEWMQSRDPVLTGEAGGGSRVQSSGVQWPGRLHAGSSTGLPPCKAMHPLTLTGASTLQGHDSISRIPFAPERAPALNETWCRAAHLCDVTAVDSCSRPRSRSLAPLALLRT